MANRILKWADRKKIVYCTTGARIQLGLNDDGRNSLMPNLDLDGGDKFDELAGWWITYAESARSRRSFFHNNIPDGGIPHDGDICRLMSPHNTPDRWDR